MNAAVYPDSYRLPAGILAVAVHGAFFALLYFGFTWQTLSPAVMSVDLWQSLPDDAVVAVPPPAAAPPVEPKLEESVPPPVEPTVEEAVPPTPPEAVLPEAGKVKPVEVEPDISLADLQAARAKEKKVAREKAEKVAREKAEKVAREKAKKVAREKAEKVARDKAEQVVRERAEQVAREKAEQVARVARERAEQAAAIGRVVDEYTGKIVSKVRRNIVMPPDVADDARAEFLVTLLPGGTVLSARLTRTSGNAAYDNAVERAILKSQPLPLPADAALFSRFRELELVFKPIE